MDAVKISKVNLDSGEVDEMVLTKSERMSVFNKARAAMKRGEFKTSDMVVRKAFSLLQQPVLMAAKFAEYGTTVRSCGCPAGQRGVMCYHRTAAMEVEKVRRMRAEKAVKVERTAAVILAELGY